MSDDEGPPLDTPNGDAAVAAVKAHGDIVLDRTKTVHPCGCIITVVKYAHREMLDDVKYSVAKDECDRCANPRFMLGER